jgi:hypothetical protein
MAKKKVKKTKARKSGRSLARKKRRARVERQLEEGLRETFPASDPPAPTDPTRSIRE